MGEARAEIHEVQQACEEQRRGSFLLRWLGYASAVLLLYVLSFGPAVKLCMCFHTISDFPRTQQVMDTIYRPLLITVGPCPLVGRFLWWYLGHIWRVPMPP